MCGHQNQVLYYLSLNLKVVFFVLLYYPKPRSQVWVLIYRDKLIGLLHSDIICQLTSGCERQRAGKLGQGADFYEKTVYQVYMHFFPIHAYK